MNASRTLWLPLLTAAGLVLAGCGASAADAGDDESRAGESRSARVWFAEWRERDHQEHARLRGATDPRYVEECGSCHLAFPPGLLDRAAWNRVFADLGDHYGENASLDPATASRLRELVLAHAGDGPGLVPAVLRGEPPRITATPWFVREHDEIPPRRVAGNPDVGSFANCGACHARAGEGSFRESEIAIPGFGRWDD